jgi:hypothetical protein
MIVKNKKISKARYAYLIATLPIWFPLSLLAAVVIVVAILMLQGALSFTYVLYRMSKFVCRDKSNFDVDSWSEAILRPYINHIER